MKTYYIIAAIPALLFASCTATNPTSARNSNVEALERQGQDVQPNVNHGQHEAGYNAVKFNDSGTRAQNVAENRGSFIGNPFLYQ